jgi:antitoxin VapB
MTTVNSKVFRSGNSEAVRLPREVAYGSDLDVTITRSGDVVTIRPKQKMTPAELVAALRALPKPSSIQKRPPFFAPKRKGL